VHATAQIEGNEHRSLAFFVKKFGVGSAGSRGHSPIDGPYVITSRVLSDLIKFDAASAPMGPLRTCEVC
jgi:hypothetical protein